MSWAAKYRQHEKSTKIHLLRYILGFAINLVFFNRSNNLNYSKIMKAINIINKLSKELEETYSNLDDFCGWAAHNSNAEVMIDSIVYCIDYSVTGVRQVKSELSVMKPEMIEGKKHWMKCGVDRDLKAFVESSINQIIPILFDERLQQRLEEEAAQDEAINDHIGLMDTYQSLQCFR